MAELQDFLADVIGRYPRCRQDGMRFVLVEAQDQIMPEVDPKLADWTTRELRARGIEVRTGTMLDSVEGDCAKLSSGESLPTKLVCWTAGVKPPQIVRELNLPLQPNGRIDVDRTMRVRGTDNVWAVGDSGAVPDAVWAAGAGAAVPDAAQNYEKPCPPTCQHALRQGKRAAENVAAMLGHGR